MSKKNIATLDTFIDEQYGPLGAPKREVFEQGYNAFKVGLLLHEARLEKGLTLEELAKKAGTTKSYIARVEKNIKEVRFPRYKKL
ncbi:MAG: helix-turn-helix domain-containing protein [Prevotellaceae bacterium]|jgi:DNA-binding XRE family transcriptional regulator|nr:helix-turn-helix domain-containing protein [Prevotellaceae bacterium]